MRISCGKILLGRISSNITKNVNPSEEIAEKRRFPILIVLLGLNYDKPFSRSNFNSQPPIVF